ncbi:MAG: DUF58 domain-containing protein [Verrucomicrobiota bacterium]
MRVVPSRLLLILAAFVLIPAATLVVWDDGILRAASLCVILLLIGLCWWDAARSRRLIESIDASLPDLIRGTRGRTFEVPIDFTHSNAEPLTLRYGIALSAAFRSEGEVVVTMKDLKPGQKYRSRYPLLALMRGNYRLESLHFEVSSRAGVWSLRRDIPLQTEVRVYPDLSSERKRLASHFLQRGREGNHALRQVGKGRDFEQLREYQPGDDYIDIDWKATARRGMPVTRTYQIERTQEIYVVVDHSRLSAREIRVPVDEALEGDWLYQDTNAGGEWVVTTQLEKFLHGSLILSSVAERQGDLFGFISFADKVDRFIRSRNGRDHYNVVRDALYTLEPSLVAPDYEELMITLRQRLTRRALIVMLIDLSDPLTAEQFFEALPLIQGKHLVLVNMVRPERAYPMFSQSREVESEADVYAGLGGHFQWQDLREIGNRLSHLGVELGLPEHQELCGEVVSQYLKVKRRQLI